VPEGAPTAASTNPRFPCRSAFSAIPSGGTQNLPHGHHLRKGRHSEPGRIYLITTVTFHRAPVFADLLAGRAVVDALRYCSKQGYAHTLAFVVMPDHLHWLFSLGDRLDLPRVVATAKGRSARAVNHLLTRRGSPAILPLWQEGYHDHAVRHDEDVKHLARYIVENPLRAGIVEHIGDYPLWDAKWL
jgi:REP element-mobilizing transposase RayT